MNDIFVKHLDKPTSKKLIELARQHGYEFYCNCKDMSVEELMEYFYKYNHGNSKILWHFYFNDIIKKWEIDMMSTAVKNSYPQLKNIPVTYYFGGVDIFNYV